MAAPNPHRRVAPSLYTEAQIEFLKSLVEETRGRARFTIEELTVDGDKINYMNLQTNTPELAEYLYYELERFCTKQRALQWILEDEEETDAELPPA